MFPASFSLLINSPISSAEVLPVRHAQFPSEKRSFLSATKNFSLVKERWEQGKKMAALPCCLVLNRIQLIKHLEILHWIQKKNIFHLDMEKKYISPNFSQMQRICYSFLPGYLYPSSTVLSGGIQNPLTTSLACCVLRTACFTVVVCSIFLCHA